MGKEITTGLVILGGAGLVAIAAEASLPILATIGAVSALGAGVYEAVSSPRRRKSPPSPLSQGGSGESKDVSATLVGSRF